MEEVKIYEGAIDRGLEGVVACSTAISQIQDATLCYRGYTIEDLAEHVEFEEVVYLLWENKLPSAAELATFRTALRNEMVLSQGYADILKAAVKIFPKDGHPMDFLRTAVSAVSFVDPETNDNSPEARRRKMLRLTAKMGSIVAAFERLRHRQEIVPAQVDKSIAWNFLHMMTGKDPDPEFVRIFDMALVLHADHELNCSTFAAKVVVSSLSDLYSGIVGAIGALKGPLHGGANSAVMKMLMEIGTVDKAKDFVEKALQDKAKVMGIGHRVYKHGDPRAKILRKFSESLTKKIGKPELYEMSALIDDTMFAKKGLMPNVDFYSATVYYSMGIPSDLFTPIFAASRIAGWCAHMAEQLENNRIYRPRGKYVGKTDLKVGDRKKL